MTNVVNINTRVARQQVDELDRFCSLAERLVEEEPDEEVRAEKRLKAEELRDRIEQKRFELDAEIEGEESRG